LAYSKIEAVKDNSDLEHPAVRETLRFMGVTEGLEIHHDADLPARTGLGSSSAFTVGLLNCLYHMKGRPQTKQTLALQAIDIERNYCKEHVGCQDQVATALGGLNHLKFKFIDGQPNYECNKVKISQTRIAELERHLMLFFTGFSRTASEIAKYQLANLPQKLSEMGRMYQMVSEAIDILHTGDIMSFGELLHEAWLIKRDLSDKVSNYVIDQYYSNASSRSCASRSISS
jgi:D-glycero-alpha-D-manno-heptose-7-phosphate kinase